MVSGGLYISVRGERILVDLRSVEESVVLALRSIGDIIDLGSVGKRSNLLVVCVGDVIDVGGVRVPVLFMKRVRLRRGWYMVVVGMKAFGVCGILLRFFCICVLEFYEKNMGVRYAYAVLCGLG